MTVLVNPLPLKEGSRGDAVYRIQEMLGVLKLYTGQIDGHFGSRTKEAVLTYQAGKNLTRDGIVGQNTVIALDNDAWAAQQPVIREGSRGEAVRGFQEMYSNYLGSLTIDGVFGPKTKDAVMNFQRSRGLTPDGVVGSKTWSELRSYSTHDIPTDQRISFIFEPQGC
ncbi:peptidoglycan-binding domain-containing protein [Calothrix sp. NIES-3974]|uniref:peptidoglycan-binding domain-containing protein n=1 Tax=Calothrix sp. NIES-3974 TaxID=2005462 RepID=UPI000B60FC32|nr:peptidoglycan-binding protein [Calothrix sp. NIES-3974]BAZ03838.1 peptidoglycan-binding domain 1 [Calothrix sp. NIES-3974]